MTSSASSSSSTSPMIAPGGITGNQEGVVWLSTMITTACPPGTYIYEVSVFDQQGNQSNVLPASFTLNP